MLLSYTWQVALDVPTGSLKPIVPTSRVTVPVPQRRAAEGWHGGPGEGAPMAAAITCVTIWGQDGAGRGARGPQGAQRGGGGPLLPGPGQASDTQTYTFLALSGSYCQVDGINVNGDKDPGPRREGSRRKESINSFG